MFLIGWLINLYYYYYYYYYYYHYYLRLVNIVGKCPLM